MLLQATFQVLPIFVRLSRDVVAVQALGTSALLLVWIYVMANVIVFGAEGIGGTGVATRTRSLASLSNRLLLESYRTASEADPPSNSLLLGVERGRRGAR